MPKTKKWIYLTTGLYNSKRKHGKQFSKVRLAVFPQVETDKQMTEQIIRVRLAKTNDPYTDLTAGSLGTKTGEYIDPWGSSVIRVKWDNGSNLSLIEGEDSWTEFILNEQ